MGRAAAEAAHQARTTCRGVWLWQPSLRWRRFTCAAVAGRKAQTQLKRPGASRAFSLPDLLKRPKIVDSQAIHLRSTNGGKWQHSFDVIHLRRAALAMQCP